MNDTDPGKLCPRCGYLRMHCICKLYFIGPQWQIDLVRQQYGDNIDYYELKPILVGR